mmetsp:Transcript_97551/g.247846  ORF Transcript_97551/g.247846 Transcript_97551/m.247846 type:complete len:251 (-) Transcript_97551:35-787(-)
MRTRPAAPWRGEAWREAPMRRAAAGLRRGEGADQPEGSSSTLGATTAVAKATAVATATAKGSAACTTCATSSREINGSKVGAKVGTAASKMSKVPTRAAVGGRNASAEQICPSTRSAKRAALPLVTLFARPAPALAAAATQRQAAASAAAPKLCAWTGPAVKGAELAEALICHACDAAPPRPGAAARGPATAKFGCGAVAECRASRPRATATTAPTMPKLNCLLFFIESEGAGIAADRARPASLPGAGRA